ncbi:MYXO-CTERM sorting domain-containing protein, partial [Streptomyces anulatus]
TGGSSTLGLAALAALLLLIGAGLLRRRHTTA